MHKNNARYFICFAALAAALAVLAALNLYFGSVKFSASEIAEIIFKNGGDVLLRVNIIRKIRLPRIAAAIILGGALSVSGYLLQTFFGNPLAGPFVLGISSGAKLAVALTMIFFLQRGTALSSASLITAAFFGSMISMGFILAVSGKTGKSAALIICGVMIGYICSAITDFAVTFADDSNIVNLRNWSMGSFSGISSEDIKTVSIAVFPAFAAVILISKQIGAYRFGETYARSVGLNTTLFRAVLIFLSSILSACVTAFAGPVSFVGIAVPHIVKSLFKTAKPAVIIPASFMAGGAFCLFCDLIARTAFAPLELSISSVTALFGAPIVIFIMLKKSKKNFD